MHVTRRSFRRGPRAARPSGLEGGHENPAPGPGGGVDRGRQRRRVARVAADGVGGGVAVVVVVVPRRTATDTSGTVSTLALVLLSRSHAEVSPFETRSRLSHCLARRGRIARVTVLPAPSARVAWATIGGRLLVRAQVLATSRMTPRRSPVVVGVVAVRATQVVDPGMVRSAPSGVILVNSSIYVVMAVAVVSGTISMF